MHLYCDNQNFRHFYVELQTTFVTTKIWISIKFNMYSGFLQQFWSICKLWFIQSEVFRPFSKRYQSPTVGFN